MISRLRSKATFEVLVICVIGLLPLWWFKPNEIIFGHDAGLTLSPKSHFEDRLSSWTHRFSFGADQTSAIPGFFIHGIEAAISITGVSLSTNQKITFVFWFILPALTMYLLAKKISNKYHLTQYALPVAVFYMMNHFILQAWFVAERTKFSIYAALPLLLLILYHWYEHRNSSSVRAGCAIALVFFFLNGMASLPLYGSVGIVIAASLVLHVLMRSNAKDTMRLIRLILSTSIVSVLLNAYWLLPLIQYLRSSFQQTVELHGGYGGVITWLKYISENTSFFNLFRLQGIPEWYQNPGHPYANIFLANPVLIVLSCFIPIIMFLPLYLYRKKTAHHFILFCAALSLVSLIFMAGAHAPFGAWYTLMVEHVPGFVAFRNPFYKFTPALLLAYALLWGFTIQAAYSYLTLKMGVRLASGAYCVSILALTVYSYPFLNGGFFDYIKDTRSMKVEVPAYIYDYIKWSEHPENLERRTLMLPLPNEDNNIETYSWGYWSLAPLTSLITNSQSINTNFLMTPEEQALTRQLNKHILSNDPTWKSLAAFLRIDSIVVRNDFVWDSTEAPTTNPTVYQKILNNEQDIQKVKQFGQWDIYALQTEPYPKLTASNSVAVFVGTNLPELVNVPTFKSDRPVYKWGENNAQNNRVLAHASAIYLNPACAICDGQWPFIDMMQYTPLITRGSVFFKLFPYHVYAQRSKQNSLQYYFENSLIALQSYRKAFDQRENQQVLVQSIEDHYYFLNQTKNILQSSLSNTNLHDKEIMQIASMIRAERYAAIQSLDELDRVEDNELKKQVTPLLFRNVMMISEISNSIQPYMWQADQNIVKRFTIENPFPGTYQMLYRPNDTAFDSANTFTYTAGSQTYTASPRRINTEWYDVGSISLPQGDTRIEIQHTPSNYFEGNSQTTLASTREGNCFKSNIIKIDKYEVYEFSFVHMRKSGNKDFYADIVEKDKVVNPYQLQDRLTSESYPNKYKRTYANPLKKEVQLVVCDRPALEDKAYSSELLMSEITIEKLNNPDLLLYNERDTSHEVRTQSRINQNSKTEYTITETTPGLPFITLHHSYSPSWQLSGTKSEKIELNGYANAWLIDDAVGTLTVEYSIENQLKIGAIISVISLIIVATYMVVTEKLYARKNKS